MIDVCFALFSFWVIEWLLLFRAQVAVLDRYVLLLAVASWKCHKHIAHLWRVAIS